MRAAARGASSLYIFPPRRHFIFLNLEGEFWRRVGQLLDLYGGSVNFRGDKGLRGRYIERLSAVRLFKEALRFDFVNREILCHSKFSMGI